MKKISTCTLIMAIIVLAGCSTTPFMKAVIDGDTKTASDLIDKGANVNEELVGYSALSYAVRNEDYSTVKLLLDRGAEIYDYILPEAVRKKNVPILKLLLDRGARVDSNALYHAKQQSDIRILQMLEAAMIKAEEQQLKKHQGKEQSPASPQRNDLL